jgi:hypothetical protein
LGLSDWECNVELHVLVGEAVDLPDGAAWSLRFDADVGILEREGERLDSTDVFSTFVGFDQERDEVFVADVKSDWSLGVHHPLRPLLAKRVVILLERSRAGRFTLT